MSRRTIFLALAGLVLLAAAVTVSTVLTVAGDPKDPRCPDRAYGCAEFRRGEEIRVGLLTTPPGRTSTAREARRGAELAIAAHGGRLAGRPLELLAEEDECSATGAARGARELASDPPFEPPVIAVVGMTCPAGLQAAAQILSDSGVALVTTTRGPVAFTDPPRSFLARPAVAEPDRSYRRLYRDRYGHPPSDPSAWTAYSLTRRILMVAEDLAVPGSEGSLLVPRSPLHRALATS